MTLVHLLVLHTTAPSAAGRSRAKPTSVAGVSLSHSKVARILHDCIEGIDDAVVQQHLSKTETEQGRLIHGSSPCLKTNSLLHPRFCTPLGPHYRNGHVSQVYQPRNGPQLRSLAPDSTAHRNNLSVGSVASVKPSITIVGLEAQM